MKREMEKRKKIEAVAAIIAVVLALFIVGMGPTIVADTSSPDDPVYDGTVAVTLNATDDYSGVAGIYFALDPPVSQMPGEINWTYVEGEIVTFDVTEPGNHTVFFYSVDNAGNEEACKTKSFVIYEDAIAPVTTIDLQGQLHQP